MGQSGGRVGGSDEGECAIVFGIFEYGECVFEGIVSIGHSVVDVALYVSVSDKSVNDFSATHQIIISNTNPTPSIYHNTINHHTLLLFITFIRDSFTSIILFKSMIYLFSWSFSV